MILGVTILRKKYPLAKYLCVLLIVSGVAMFLYKPNKTSAVADDHVFGFGEILLVRFYLVLNSLHFTCIIKPLSYVGFQSAPLFCSHGNSDISMTFILWLVCVLCFVIAGLSDIRRFDWCGSGPHAGSLSDWCQPHDAEHQHVVHSGARSRWGSCALWQTPL